MEIVSYVFLGNIYDSSFKKIPHLRIFWVIFRDRGRKRDRITLMCVREKRQLVASFMRPDLGSNLQNFVVGDNALTN